MVGFFIAVISLSTATDVVQERPFSNSDAELSMKIDKAVATRDEAKESCGTQEYEYSKETGSCYKIYRVHEIWSEANKTCANDGAYLVILNDEHEAKIVVEMFSKESRLPASWVGVRDDTGMGQWHSVHGDPMDKIYNVWHKYSTNLYVSEACALLNPEGKLYDYYCNYYYHAICEKKPHVL
ncbi:unnamed protein product [Arctia plantaginis]|uniref:C-type lectin domain-containing protein n=1 Tax=Arctia plantaginis TaxID=874455 RepID=A0A8S1AG46_ARCPL|nr:unnamed protein product [Arctia plantaginis]